MSKLRIFIASSSEQKSNAAKIADSLAKSGHEPVRWWTSFDPGKYTLEVLIEQMRGCDAGIFYCVGDDQSSYRDNDTTIPRDNVIFELGLFVSSLGRRRCIFLWDQNDPKLRLPSDLLGLTALNANLDPDSLASEISENLKQSIEDEASGTEDQSCIHVHADKEVAPKASTGSIPSDWHQRALYCGSEGAKAWLAYTDEEYSKVHTQGDHNLDRNETIQALGTNEWRVFVSFGPGDARRDRYIVDTLQSRSNIVHYIPVDISDGLIHQAFKEIRNAGAIVPFGVVGDFEDRQGFIFQQINCFSQTPRLIGLLGNTLGNLDIGAEAFLDRVIKNLRPGDGLLLDIATRNTDWGFDPYKSGGYFDSDVRRRFIAQGIARQVKGLSAETILSEFEDRIRAKSVSAPDYAQQYVIYDVITQKTAFSLRVYKFNDFCEWLSKKPRVRLSWKQEYAYEGTPNSGSGLIRLERTE